MTARLYYTDAMRRTFDATVVSCDVKGETCEVVLDQTAFYPTSGGQPFDTGSLGDRRVLEVSDAEDGGVVHVVDGPMSVGARVSGDIDWDRRFDHMQQHTGQHMLSAAFDRLFGVRTESFHLGAETSTIDLAREVTPDEIARAEEEASRVAWEDRPVTVRFVDAAEASALPLRKASERAGTLRLVEIAGFDVSACGGTHVTSTGMIGIVAVAGWERFKGGSRVTFVCGRRALRSHARFRDTTTTIMRLLSTSQNDAAAAIERLQAEARTLAKASQQLGEQLAGYRGAALRATAETMNGLAVVLTQEPARDAASLKRLATAVVSAPGTIALIVGEGHPAPVVIARSTDVDFDAAAWLRQAISALGGRGGGRNEQAQGGLAASPGDVIEYGRGSISKVASAFGVNTQANQQ
jgi:alanyl-tRNA synthetase